MNIFDYLDDIIVTKENILEDDLENADDFSPFLLQRWLSMRSPEFAQIVNSTSNVLWKGLEDKQLWYKFYLGTIPRSSRKRINYIKKNKEAKKGIDKEFLEYCANEFELSEREIRLYLASGLLDVKELKERFNI